MSEIRWAWRNIVARRWRAVLTIVLLAVALAATTVVFSAADSLVFRRVAYLSKDRLVTFDTRDAESGRPGGGFASAAVLDEWRKQTALFAGVHGHFRRVAAAISAWSVGTCSVPLGATERGFGPRASALQLDRQPTTSC
jgi:hypothetical protein